MKCMHAQTGPQFIFSSERALGNRVRPHVNCKEKIASTRGSEEGWAWDAASRRISSTTHYPLGYSDPTLQSQQLHSSFCIPIHFCPCFSAWCCSLFPLSYCCICLFTCIFPLPTSTRIITRSWTVTNCIDCHKSQKSQHEDFQSCSWETKLGDWDSENVIWSAKWKWG